MAARPGLPPLPARLSHLAVSPDGYPVPWFVAYVDGVPDFRCSDSEKFVRALRENLCWVCGAPNGSFKAFPIGPMCVINRATAEPPCHYECAEYAVRACPFLANPKRRRREKDMPEGGTAPGCMIKRNPGATAIYVTKKFRPFRANGVMFDLGTPERVTWWCEGRTATRAEVDESIEGGLPLLRQQCDLDRPGAHAELDRRIADAQRWLPTAPLFPEAG